MKKKHLWQVITLCLFLGSVQCVHSQDAYQLGEEALQYGNYEQAIRYLKNTTPTGKSLIRIGFAYSQLGRYKEATDIYQKALRLVKAGEFESANPRCDSTSIHRIRVHCLPTR